MCFTFMIFLIHTHSLKPHSVQGTHHRPFPVSPPPAPAPTMHVISWAFLFPSDFLPIHHATRALKTSNLLQTIFHLNWQPAGLDFSPVSEFQGKTHTFTTLQMTTMTLWVQVLPSLELKPVDRSSHVLC